MVNKIKSEIIKIEIDKATFNGTKTAITPTYINLFFGNNGTGKSTIAHIIESGKGVTYTDGNRSEDYIMLVYDQKFINDNMQNYHNLKGIFTFDEINSAIQSEFDRINNCLTEAKNKQIAAEQAKTESEERLAELDEKFVKSQYSVLKPLRNKFKKLLPSKFGTSKTLISEIRQYLNKANLQDENEMQKQYDAIYRSDAREYEEFPTISDSAALDKIENQDILEVVIANAAQTEFAQFLARIGATEWMRQAHKRYHNHSEGYCPYCYRMLDPDFEQKFIESFDDRYEKNLLKLNDFLEKYRNKANEIFIHIRKLPEDIYPYADEKEYRKKLEVLKSVISGNIELIKSKIAEPYKKVSLVNITPYLQDISEITNTINSMIRTNNIIFNTKKVAIWDLQESLFCHMAYILKENFKYHEQQREAIRSNIEKQKNIISEQNDSISELKRKIREMHSNVKDTTIAMNNINEMLYNANFQGFEMRPHIDELQPFGNKKPINYEVVRTSNDKIATDLSEGEKNFIAFLYFLQKVLGNETDQKDTREKIIVIDDPVSNMDNNSMLIISEQIKKMIEVCLHNIDNKNIQKNSSIKQIFVFTHNAHFYREITYPYADNYKSVSLYLIRKINNLSSVHLCERQDSSDPTTMVNVNPIKDSYTALWDDYREISSVISLLNITKMILNRYFLQLLGYKRNKFRKIILEENQDIFTHDKNGNNDNTKYYIASTMLSCIDTISYNTEENLYYTDNSMDINIYRKTFQMIFECMHQKQHYNMMMGIEERKEE